MPAAAAGAANAGTEGDAAASGRATGSTTGRPPHGWQRLVDIRPGEWPLLAWALLYVFCVLSAYYVIRPIRDEMGVHGGVQNLQWLFTGTLLAMLALNPAFAALVRRYSRERFITLTYAFFMLNLALFMAALTLLTGEAQQVWLGRAFFIWTSVFNLFVVSVFWALMVDIFDSEQGKRLFGILAAGATLGAMAGSMITATLVRDVGANLLLAASILLLGGAILAVRQLSRRSQSLSRHPGAATQTDRPIGGGLLAGITHTLRSRYLLNIAGYMLLFAITSTFLYFQQAAIVSEHFTDRASRTEFFARIDLLVNVLTLLIQIFLTSRILKVAGVALTAAILPLITLVGFGALALAPTIALLVAVQVARRVGNFALARPTRELLFTVLSREDKYKAKNLIDTAVYRAGDQVGSWSYALLAGAGLGMTGIAVVALPLSLLWIGNAVWLGRRQQTLAGPPTEPPTAAS